MYEKWLDKLQTYFLSYWGVLIRKQDPSSGNRNTLEIYSGTKERVVQFLKYGSGEYKHTLLHLMFILHKDRFSFVTMNKQMSDHSDFVSRNIYPVSKWSVSHKSFLILQVNKIQACTAL